MIDVSTGGLGKIDVEIDSSRAYIAFKRNLCYLGIPKIRILSVLDLCGKEVFEWLTD